MKKSGACIQKQLAVLVLLTLIRHWAIAASGDQNWDADFGVPGATSPAWAAMAAGDDAYFIGGFHSIGGKNISYLARWDGNSWAALGAGPDAAVLCVAGSASNLYAGGLFTNAGGVTVNRIARWDGANWSALGAGLNASPLAMAIVGGNLYVGGGFTMAGGNPALRLARWDGTNWLSMGSFTNYSPGCRDFCFDDGNVLALGAKGHELYVGGRFVYAGNIFATNIAKWDGTNWSPLGFGTSGQVDEIAINDDVYVAGDFRRLGALTVNGIARWDGTRWYDLAGGTSDLLWVTALAANGKDIYAGGSFRRIGGVSAEHVAKWDGTNWSSLGSGIPGGVGSLACNGSELFVGGHFNSVGGKPSTNIALWHIPHALNISRTAEGVLLSWPGTGTNFLLEACSDLGQSNWTQVLQPPVLAGQQLVVTQEMCALSRFYRLRRR